MKFFNSPLICKTSLSILVHQDNDDDNEDEDESYGHNDGHDGAGTEALLRRRIVDERRSSGGDKWRSTDRHLVLEVVDPMDVAHLKITVRLKRNKERTCVDFADILRTVYTCPDPKSTIRLASVE